MVNFCNGYIFVTVVSVTVGTRWKSVLALNVPQIHVSSGTTTSRHSSPSRTSTSTGASCLNSKPCVLARTPSQQYSQKILCGGLFPTAGVENVHGAVGCFPCTLVYQPETQTHGRVLGCTTRVSQQFLYSTEVNDHACSTQVQVEE